ncbi:hypothetical protein F5Y00DRAFT_266238 [Daldinia vernicosa]|uniref:uncharacterized protein n=1 Tax=Daldinia vernicosa TaxID=114800 RepID=UPI002007D89F|nr:uncharacterized protein F5Y00DRAFT_266238 [Daldinia vernicosa]KAI0844816.1 hypothetical protein F5Y00DRAFT_266238 [Daldinia vernicosa]
MEPQNPVVFRRKILTNSAAEFVEREPGIEALFQPEDSYDELKDSRNASEFIPEIDRFAPKGVIFDRSKYYERSLESKRNFLRTLKNFVSILRDRKIESELNIVIKDPSETHEFTFEYVLGIIDKIGESRNNSTKTRSCKNFIRRCYHKLEDNRDVFEGILDMIPDDIYGSILSGGFALILAAVEKHAEQREEIQNFLAEIPGKLNTIQRLSAIHQYSYQLHSCADNVMVAVFTVMERIVDTITRSWKVRLTQRAGKITQNLRSLPYRNKRSTEGNEVKGDQGDNLTVADALANLEREVQCFQNEVSICDQERLGRIERGNGDLKLGIAFVEKGLEKLSTDIMTVVENGQRFLENMVAKTSENNYQTLLLLFKNTLYQLCTSNPVFNGKTGGIDLNELQLLQAERMRSYQQGNKLIALRLFKKLAAHTNDPMIDIKDCLEHIWLLDADEKNMCQSILESKELDDWFGKDQSSIFEVNLPTPSAALNNPLSFSSAMLATALISTTQFPVLAFFCKHRNNEHPLEDEKSGPVALARDLSIQLIRFISDHRPSVDLSLLRSQKSLPKVGKSLKEELSALNSLLFALPENDTVFIMIDSLSYLSGNGNGGNKVIEKLVRTMKNRRDITIKLMVTDTPAEFKLKALADISYTVPDSVGGLGVVDVAESGDEVAKVLRRKMKTEDGRVKNIGEDVEDYSNDDEKDEQDDEEDEDKDDEEGEEGDDDDNSVEVKSDESENLREDEIHEGGDDDTDTDE